MAFLHNDKEQFAEAIHLTAYQTGIMAQAIEKDYYVSLIFAVSLKGCLLLCSRAALHFPSVMV